ncbi:MAG: acyl-CoA synthetase, partial [Afipia sp.]
MSHPSIHAQSTPDKIAYQMAGSGEAITYRDLDRRSNQGAHLFRSLGLKKGDHIALLMENNIAFMEICWAAQRSGLYYTAISRYLTPDEIAYIVKDCGAQVVITTPKCMPSIEPLLGTASGATQFFITGAARGDFKSGQFKSWDDALASQPVTPIADEAAGYDMLYSSGTTGRPKGIKRPLTEPSILVPNPLLKLLCSTMCGMNETSVY